MTLNDDNHRVAKIIKDLEERVSDLEEASRDRGETNPLITVYDRLGIGDTVAFNSHDLQARGTWDNPGWDTAGWEAYE